MEQRVQLGGAGGGDFIREMAATEFYPVALSKALS